MRSIMVFGAVMPATVGLANWMIPMQIGAADMALPRMNLFSFWLLAFAFLLLLSTFLMPGGAPASGWTLYPPLVLQIGRSLPDGDFLDPPDGRLVDHGRDQRHRDHRQHARAGHDAAEDAALLLVLADHRVSADRGDAGVRGRA